MKYTLYDGVNDRTKRFGTIFTLYYLFNLIIVNSIFSFNGIEFTYQVIPRFYQTFIESGVVKIHLVLGSPKERPVNTPNGVQSQIDCPSSSIEYHFSNGIQVK